jgi:hypothetical protein
MVHPESQTGMVCRDAIKSSLCTCRISTYERPDGPHTSHQQLGARVTFSGNPCANFFTRLKGISYFVRPAYCFAEGVGQTSTLAGSTHQRAWSEEPWRGGLWLH